MTPTDMVSSTKAGHEGGDRQTNIQATAAVKRQEGESKAGLDGPAPATCQHVEAEHVARRHHLAVLHHQVRMRRRVVLADYVAVQGESPSRRTRSANRGSGRSASSLGSTFNVISAKLERRSNAFSSQAKDRSFSPRPTYTRAIS